MNKTSLLAAVLLTLFACKKDNGKCYRCKTKETTTKSTDPTPNPSVEVTDSRFCKISEDAIKRIRDERTFDSTKIVNGTTIRIVSECNCVVDPQ